MKAKRINQNMIYSSLVHCIIINEIKI